MVVDIDSILIKRADVLKRACAYEPAIGHMEDIFLHERMQLIMHMLNYMSGKDKASALYLVETLQEWIMAQPKAGR